MSIRYPTTRKVEQYDAYFGTIVHDPYRWLEGDSDEVREWIRDQNDLTESYLRKIPFREQLRNRVEELMNFPRYRSAKKFGNTYYFLHNDGLQEQFVLHVQEGLTGTPRVFLDPSKYSDDGSITLVSFVLSNDGRYMSCSFSKSGSDWTEVRVVDVESGKELSDIVCNVFAPPGWTPHWYQDGFYYSQWGDPVTGVPIDDDQYCVRYHKLGTRQEEDELVYAEPDRPELCFALPTAQSEKMQFLVIFDAKHSGNKLYLRDMQSNAKDFIRFHDDPRFEVIEIDEVGGKALLKTNIDAATYRVVLTDTSSADPQMWKTIIPAREETIDEVHYAGGKIIVIYSKDVRHHAYQYDMNGNLEHEIELPGIGTVEGFECHYDDPRVLFEFSGFTTPRSIYEYDVRTYTLTLFKRNEVPYSVSDYDTEQTFVTSKDGTRLPVFVVSKAGLKRDGSHPVLLTGYGGFNVILTPSFRPALIAFLEQGGVFVQANIRGGGEYGEEWYKAGSRLNKQNSFDDFIAVAEYLCREAYTNSERLAISGSSHGGLLVGAAMIQRPDLFRVAIPDVGVFDMLRFHKLGGLDYAREYGASDIENDFRNLFSYSPLHTLKDATVYPSTLVRTAEHDDRVVPAHSYKFAARLQECQSGQSPVLLGVSMQSGHGKGLSLSRAIAKVADDYAFILWEMGFRSLI